MCFIFSLNLYCRLCTQVFLLFYFLFSMKAWVIFLMLKTINMPYKLRRHSFWISQACLFSGVTVLLLEGGAYSSRKTKYFKLMFFINNWNLSFIVLLPSSTSVMIISYKKDVSKQGSLVHMKKFKQIQNSFLLNSQSILDFNNNQILSYKAFLIYNIFISYQINNRRREGYSKCCLSYTLHK